MKKFFFLAVFALGAMTMTSCKKNCCSLATVKVCEDDFNSATYSSWDDAKKYYEGAGWNCD